MIKFSGGYTAINPNFIISNIPQGSDVDFETAGLIAVLKNILLRGVPTHPSAFLLKQKNLGIPPKNEECWYAHRALLPQWNKVIKGEGIDAPARNFWQRFQTKFPQESTFFLPECRLNQVYLDEKNTIPDDYQIDFYSPLYGIAIEVDDGSHGTKEQQKKDEIRNRIIELFGEELIRVPVKKLFDKEWLTKFVNEIKRRFKSVACPIKRVEEISEEQKRYMYIFRLQMVLLSLFEKGVISLNNKVIKLNLQGEFEEDVFWLAVDDLLFYFENLFALADKMFNRPQFVLSKDAEITIDIDLFANYEECDFYEGVSNTIRVRNDYFPYNAEAETDKETYAVRKNYYKIAESDFRFRNVNASNSAHKAALEFFLKTIFGFDEFRPNQLEIIAEALSDETAVIGLLPTGSGKSICYQLVNLLTPAIGLVITPLTVLMDDQVRNLNEKLVMTACQIHQRKRNSIPLIKNKHVKLLYLSPERFFSKDFVDVIRNLPVGQIVLDEVHCLSEWGHDFRTSYLLLFGFLKEMGWTEHVLLMGTSATGSPRVVEDIQCEFKGIKENVQIITAKTIKRDELTLEVFRFDYERDRDEKLRELASQNKSQKTLIFAVTKKDVKERVYEGLIKGIKGVSGGFYHADNAGDRGNCDETQNQANKVSVYQNFAKGKTKCLVATKAFGMGVDIPDIRRTIHYHLAGSVEALYQEMGRAGRDGRPAHCAVFLWEYPKIKKAIDEAFSENFSVDFIHNLHSRENIGDLRKQAFFLTRDCEDAESWASFVCKGIHPFLNGNRDRAWDLNDLADYLCNNGIIQRDKEPYFKKQNGIISDSKLDYDYLKGKLEKALYKLYTLGVIGLWHVTYANGQMQLPIYSDVVLHRIDNETLVENLHSHIRKYDYHYKYTGEYNLFSCVKTLCQWDTEKFLAYRWESLKNLYRMLSEYKDSDDFATRIDNFFSRNEKLENAVKNYQDTSAWMELLKTTDPEILRDSIARYLQEQSEAPHLRFLSALVACRTHNFNTEQQNHLIGSILNLKRNGINFDSLIEICIGYLSVDQQSLWEFLILLIDRLYNDLGDDIFKRILLKLPASFGEESIEILKDRMKYNALYSRLKKLQSVLGDNK